MAFPLVLVTGATGYIASRLVPRLLAAGYRVRCLAREPRRLEGRSWFPRVEVVQGDVISASALRGALEGVHTAYYLVHNMSHGRGYTALELDGARSFAAAAAEAGVEHIIYLGGLADPEQHIAPHMRSRIETGRVLREGRVPVTEFRAGVIIGSGSISFEMIRFMTELCPLIPGPVGMKNKSQPIAVQNVIDYLLAALTNPAGRGEVFEIGGTEIVKYADLMLRYARVRGLRRWVLLLPGLPLWFMALGVDWITPVPYPIAYALIDGLSADSLVKHPQALGTFPDVELIDFETAVKDALAKTHPAHIERVWADGKSGQRSIRHEGCFIDHREIPVEAAARKVLHALASIAERRGWVAAAHDPVQQTTAYIQNQVPGTLWFEWRTIPAGSTTHLSQTVFFCPRGLPGFLYWYLFFPFHVFKYRGLIKAIAHRSELQ